MSVMGILQQLTTCVPFPKVNCRVIMSGHDDRKKASGLLYIGSPSVDRKGFLRPTGYGKIGSAGEGTRPCSGPVCAHRSECQAFSPKSTLVRVDEPTLAVSCRHRGVLGLSKAVASVHRNARIQADTHC